MSTNAVVLASAAGTGFFRNKLINGAFDVWQRGTSFSAVTPIFTADRWFVTHAGSALVASYTRLDAAGVWGEAKYYIRLARTSGSGMTQHSFTQRIEGVETLQGSKATFSFDCRDVNGAQTIGVRLVQNFGSSGSADVTIASQSVSVPTGSTPQRRSVTFDIPSIAGKTIGANNYLALIIDLPLGGNFQIDISNAQLEAGAVATPFERRPPGQELLLCKRYCESISVNSAGNDRDIGLGFGNGQGGQFQFTVFWTVVKRSPPTVTTAAASDFYVHLPGTFRVTCGSISAGDVTELTGHFSATTSSPTLSSGQGVFVAAASTGTILILANSEL